MNNFKTICIEIYEYFIVLQNLYFKKYGILFKAKLKNFEKNFFF